MVHDVAAAGFNDPGDYEAARPSYPPDAVQWFVDLMGLHAGGRLGLVWNARIRTVPWVDAVWTIMDRVEKRAPWRDHENWRDSAFRTMPGFGELRTAEFHHAQPTTPEGVVRRVASVSHVAVLP